jgi:hypothetical protein
VKALILFSIYIAACVSLAALAKISRTRIRSFESAIGFFRVYFFAFSPTSTKRRKVSGARNPAKGKARYQQLGEQQRCQSLKSLIDRLRDGSCSMS